jgi:hypothetical protein
MSPSTRSLLLANAGTLVAALLLQWPAGWLLWPYWIQSVVIGWFARKRMLGLYRFITDGFTSNDQPVPENAQGKRSTANFFTLHYGFFHLCYLIFLCAEHPLTAGWDLLVLGACAASFVLSQRQTYAVQHDADLRGRPNLGTLMFTPYLRVLPMHLAILLGAALGGGAGLLVLFTVLKTASDVGMDAVDRRLAEKHADRVEADETAASPP